MDFNDKELCQYAKNNQLNYLVIYFNNTGPASNNKKQQ